MLLDHTTTNDDVNCIYKVEFTDPRINFDSIAQRLRRGTAASLSSASLRTVAAPSKIFHLLSKPIAGTVGLVRPVDTCNSSYWYPLAEFFGVPHDTEAYDELQDMTNVHELNHLENFKIAKRYIVDKLKDIEKVDYKTRDARLTAIEDAERGAKKVWNDARAASSAIDDLPPRQWGETFLGPYPPFVPKWE